MMNKLSGYFRDQPLKSACWSYVILTVVPGLFFPADHYLAESLVRFVIPGALAVWLAVRYYGADFKALSYKGIWKGLLYSSPAALLCAANLIFFGGSEGATAPRILWIVCGAVSEELLGRMFLFGGIRAGAASRGWGTGMTIALAGFAFGAMHAINYASQGVTGVLVQCLYTGCLGALFAWAYHKSGSLWGGIVWHVLLNLTSLL